MYQYMYHTYSMFPQEFQNSNEERFWSSYFIYTLSITEKAIFEKNFLLSSSSLFLSLFHFWISTFLKFKVWTLTELSSYKSWTFDTFDTLIRSRGFTSSYWVSTTLFSSSRCKVLFPQIVHLPTRLLLSYYHKDDDDLTQKIQHS